MNRKNIFREYLEPILLAVTLPLRLAFLILIRIIDSIIDVVRWDIESLKEDMDTEETIGESL